MLIGKSKIHSLYFHTLSTLRMTAALTEVDESTNACFLVFHRWCLLLTAGNARRSSLRRMRLTTSPPGQEAQWLIAIGPADLATQIRVLLLCFHAASPSGKSLRKCSSINRDNSALSETFGAEAAHLEHPEHVLGFIPLDPFSGRKHLSKSFMAEFGR
jgi:hypothetical protein